MIIIESKKHNFRRCGVAHPTGRTEYPDGTFTAAELAVMAAEPMLTVTVAPDAPAEPEPAKTEAPAEQPDKPAAKPAKRKK